MEKGGERMNYKQVLEEQIEILQERQDQIKKQSESQEESVKIALAIKELIQEACSLRCVEPK